MRRSNPNKSKKINPFELYETPLWIWHWLFQAHPEYRNRKRAILDPSCGRALMLAHLQKYYKCKNLWGFEINKSFLQKWNQNEATQNLPQNQMFVTDFLTYSFKKQKFDTIVTNPPFSLTIEFLKKSLNLLNEGGYVVFLQKLNWVGTQARSLWLETQVPEFKYIHVISKRPVWILEDRPNNVADTIEYCFFVFQKGYKGLPPVSWLRGKDATFEDKVLANELLLQTRKKPKSKARLRFKFKLNRRKSRK